jgi:predicted flap endonuclease-1-like 5' DNA nuclease
VYFVIKYSYNLLINEKTMSYKIEEIEGIGPEFGSKLRSADMQTTEDLLRECGSKAGRETMADKTGISEKNLLEWVNLADLMRIKGVAEEYADLLEEAGVDTVKELATRNAENLVEKMAEVNEAKNLVNRVPNVEATQDWIKQAGELAPAVTH